MSRSRSVIVLAFILSSCAALRVKAGEAGLQAVDSAWIKAVKANSIEVVMACYASDAVGWFPGEPEAKGQKALRASYEQLFATNTVKDAVLSDTHYKDAGSLSVGWGKFTITVVEKASGKTNVWTGRFTGVAERRGGHWVYIVDHAPAEPPPASASEPKP